MRRGSNSRQRIALRRRIDRILRDRQSGAAEIAAAAARLLADASVAGYSEGRLQRLRLQLIRSHPAMGCVWQAVHADDPREFSNALRQSARDTIALARRTLPKAGAAVTMSYSSSVIASLARKKRTVYIGESLPGGEGARTARALMRLGVACELVPDATLAVTAGKAAFGIIGADAVTPTHIVNKVGSHLLALACRAAHIPCYVVADSSKLVPADWPVPEFDRRTPFEAVSRDLVTQLISA